MRLTQKIKNEIVNLAVSAVFELRMEAMMQRIALAIQDEKLNLGERLASDTPKEWEKYINTYSRVDVYLQHESGSVNICMPLQFCGGCSKDDYGTYREPWNHPIVAEYQNLVAEREAFEADCTDILNSCSTDTMLQGMSPELFFFCPKQKVEETAIIAVETLNRVRAVLEVKK